MGWLAVISHADAVPAGHPGCPAGPLYSALGNGFRASCTSPCVYNPVGIITATVDEGAFPAWIWDPDNLCWVSRCWLG